MEMLLFIAIALYLLSTGSFVLYLFFQRNLFQLAGTWLLGGGFLCHLLAIGNTFFQIGSLPAYNLHQTLSLAGLAMAGAFLVLKAKYNLKILGILAAPFITLILAAAIQAPNEPVADQSIFRSIWFVLHVAAVFFGEACFALACGIGILYLLQERAIKSKNHGFFYRRLPSLELLDASGYAALVIGFTLLTIGLISGFVYAKAVWGRFWSWDPKEVWAGISWLLYAALLHERLAVGWRGRRAAILAIVGFGVILFTFLGVNFWLQGHHGEFTKW